METSVINISIRTYELPEIGEKLCSRSAQCGTCSTRLISNNIYPIIMDTLIMDPCAQPARMSKPMSLHYLQYLQSLYEHEHEH